MIGGGNRHLELHVKERCVRSRVLSFEMANSDCTLACNSHGLEGFAYSNSVVTYINNSFHSASVKAAQT